MTSKLEELIEARKTRFSMNSPLRLCNHHQGFHSTELLEIDPSLSKYATPRRAKQESDGNRLERQES